MHGRSLCDFVVSHHFNWGFPSVNISRSFILQRMSLHIWTSRDINPISVVPEVIRTKALGEPFTIHFVEYQSMHLFVVCHLPFAIIHNGVPSLESILLNFFRQLSSNFSMHEEKVRLQIFMPNCSLNRLNQFLCIEAPVFTGIFYLSFCFVIPLQRHLHLLSSPLSP